MEQPQIRRIYRPFTPEERERWLKARAQAEQEKPAILAQHARLQEAAREPTVSGVVRRAIHRTGVMVSRVAAEAGISRDQLHEFLLGDRTLRSDVLDRLGRAAGLEFPLELDEPKPGQSGSSRAGTSAPLVPLPMTSAPHTPAEI
jgi:hypothetical protein